MLKDIIKEAIEESGQVLEDADALATKILTDIKETAKTLFFEGKVGSLRDFIFDIPNEKNDEIKQRLVSNIEGIIDDTDDFVQKIKSKISAKLDEIKAEKNLESLLDLLNYGHLKDMIKMFKF